MLSLVDQQYDAPSPSHLQYQVKFSMTNLFFQTFRSNTPFGQGAETGFSNFQQASTAPADMAINPMLPVAADRGFIPPPAAHAPHMPVGFAPSPSPMGMGKAPEQGWVNEFSTMNLGPHVTHAQQPRTTAHPTPASVANSPWGAGMGLHSQPRPFFMAAQPPAFSSMMGNVPAASQFTAAAGPSLAPQLDVEAFNQAFGDYDDMLFQQDIAAWKQKQQDQNDQEFKEAEADWMAKHGPSADNKIQGDLRQHLADELQQQTAQEEAREEEKPKENPEVLKKRREDEQLAKAATDIVNSVSDNSSEKFKNSQFLELMRRIANREVVVGGEGNFVDAETGEGVVTTQKENQGQGTPAETTAPQPQGQMIGGDR